MAARKTPQQKAAAKIAARRKQLAQSDGPGVSAPQAVKKIRSAKEQRRLDIEAQMEGYKNYADKVAAEKKKS